MMKQSSERSLRTLAEGRLNKAGELEKRLWAQLPTKGPFDPSLRELREAIRNQYESVILSDHELAEEREVELSLWRLHYRRIEDFRARIRKIMAALASSSSGSGPAGAGSGPSPPLPKAAAGGGGGGVANAVAAAARKEQLQKLLAMFRAFLSEASGFYHDLMSKLRSKYGLSPHSIAAPPPPAGEQSAAGGAAASEAQRQLAGVRRCHLSCHRCLIFLGDLARYKELHSERDAASRDWSVAASYYVQAAALWPASGNPFNQLAVLATYVDDDVLAVYEYYRSLAVEMPFLTARENLVLLFEKNRQRYLQSQAGGAGAKSSGARGEPRSAPPPADRVVATSQEGLKLAMKGSRGSQSPGLSPGELQELRQSFRTRFVRLNGIIFTKTGVEAFQELCGQTAEKLDEILAAATAAAHDEEAVVGAALGTEHRWAVGGHDGTTAGVLHIVVILIFTLHNVPWAAAAAEQGQGQASYAEILQRSALQQCTLRAIYEIAGRLLRHCARARDPAQSSLLPSATVLLEWCACHVDLLRGDGKQPQQPGGVLGVGGSVGKAQAFFWQQAAEVLNKLLDPPGEPEETISEQDLLAHARFLREIAQSSSGGGGVGGRAGAAAAAAAAAPGGGGSGSSGAWLTALWEDFELQGFAPLAPVHAALDFSQGQAARAGAAEGSRQTQCRIVRMLGAGRALAASLQGKGLLYDLASNVFFLPSKLPHYALLANGSATAAATGKQEGTAQQPQQPLPVPVPVPVPGPVPVPVWSAQQEGALLLLLLQEGAGRGFLKEAGSVGASRGFLEEEEEASEGAGQGGELVEEEDERQLLGDLLGREEEDEEDAAADGQEEEEQQDSEEEPAWASEPVPSNKWEQPLLDAMPAFFQVQAKPPGLDEQSNAGVSTGLKKGPSAVPHLAGGSVAPAAAAAGGGFAAASFAAAAAAVAASKEYDEDEAEEEVILFTPQPLPVGGELMALDHVAPAAQASSGPVTMSNQHDDEVAAAAAVPVAATASLSGPSQAAPTSLAAPLDSTAWLRSLGSGFGVGLGSSSGGGGGAEGALGAALGGLFGTSSSSSSAAAAGLGSSSLPSGQFLSSGSLAQAQAQPQPQPQPQQLPLKEANITSFREWLESSAVARSSAGAGGTLDPSKRASVGVIGQQRTAAGSGGSAASSSSLFSLSQGAEARSAALQSLMNLEAALGYGAPKPATTHGVAPAQGPAGLSSPLVSAAATAVGTSVRGAEESAPAQQYHQQAAHVPAPAAAPAPAPAPGPGPAQLSGTATPLADREVLVGPRSGAGAGTGVGAAGGGGGGGGGAAERSAEASDKASKLLALLQAASAGRIHLSPTDLAALSNAVANLQSSGGGGSSAAAAPVPAPPLPAGAGGGYTAGIGTQASTADISLRLARQWQRKESGATPKPVTWQVAAYPTVRHGGCLRACRCLCLGPSLHWNECAACRKAQACCSTPFLSLALSRSLRLPRKKRFLGASAERLEEAGCALV
eukprot:jgi/Mesen1/2894/ME000175S02050